MNQVKKTIELKKFRASSLGRIMTFDSGTQVTDKQLEMIDELELKKTTKTVMTDNQLKEIDDLSSRDNLTEKQNKKLVTLVSKRDSIPGLTNAQNKMLETLIAKRDAPPALSKGAKTAIEEMFVEDRFSFRKQIESKYIQKGHKMEDRAILVLSDYFGLKKPIEKNEKHYDNAYTQGTPDAIVRLGFGEGFQFDVKNVYYPQGLDGFESAVDKIYEWQGHDYNWMLGFEHGFVVKILQNIPEEMLSSEVKNFWKLAGREWYEEIPEKFVNEVRDFFDFESRMPLEDRIKIFKLETTKDHCQQMIDACTLGQAYYSTLEESWKNRNNENVEFIKGLIHG